MGYQSSFFDLVLIGLNLKNQVLRNKLRLIQTSHIIRDTAGFVVRGVFYFDLTVVFIYKFPYLFTNLLIIQFQKMFLSFIIIDLQIDCIFLWYSSAGYIVNTYLRIRKCISHILTGTERLPDWGFLEFFWSIFSGIRIECVEILRISPYLAQMQENTNQKTFETDTFYQVLRVTTSYSMLYSVQKLTQMVSGACLWGQGFNVNAGITISLFTKDSV